jgi:BASS family bile acid:Na+ symporter
MKELLLNVSRWGMLAFLLTSMLEVGLSLTVKQILAPLKNARLIILSLLGNFIVVPLLALGLAKAVRLEEPFAIGLMLLAVMPGAPFIPKIVQLARANLPFATTLMVLLMVGTVLDLPILLSQLLKVKVDVGQLEKSLLLSMLLPLFIGLALHSIWSPPGWVRRSLALLANMSGVLVIVLILALNFQSVVHVFGTGAIFAGIVFIGLSVLTGLLLGGHDREIRHALALGTGSRNIAAALLIGAQDFKDPKVNVMVTVTAIVGFFILLLTAGVFSRRARESTSSSLEPAASHPT